VALVSLATGAVIDMAIAPFSGKGTGEVNLLLELMPNLQRGNVLVADRYYPTFSTIAALQARGVDLLSISHHARTIDFTAGEVLGPKDHIVEWRKPRRHLERTEADRDCLPESVKIREFEIVIEDREGGTQTATIVTTMTDPSLTQKELADLYWKRWNCELDIRSIKHSLRMDVLRAKTPEMVRKEIWCHLLAYNLLRGTMVESARRNDVLPRQLSIKGTMQAVESFTPAMMAIDGSDTLYNALLTTIAAHRVGNRPGRLEPRFKKRRQVWGQLMTIPRHKSHRRLNREARSLN